MINYVFSHCLLYSDAPTFMASTGALPLISMYYFNTLTALSMNLCISQHLLPLILSVK
jgi:hypothetical protein